MKKITPQAQEGYLHIVGKFDRARRIVGNDIIHEPRWSINLHYTENATLPFRTHRGRPDREWWTRIVLSQRSGILCHMDGDGAMREFRITLPMPLDNPIFIYRAYGDPVEITGNEDGE